MGYRVAKEDYGQMKRPLQRVSKRDVGLRIGEQFVLIDVPCDRLLRHSSFLVYQQRGVGEQFILVLVYLSQLIFLHVFFNRFLSAKEENVQLREEVEGLHRKFDALKRFAAQKKIRLPTEFEQYQ